ncbi:MAG: four helix bundle protein [Acidobacteria bacterium]|nr:MAG: four helix bundle protein [Acidobacteriota bacterium]
MQDFRNLTAWRKAYELTLGVYRATVKFPAEERYGLSSQLRRAAASIAANIAEGCGRRGNTELRRFLEIAMGSASEVEFHLLLANDLAYLSPEVYATLHDQIVDCKRILSRLIVTLRSSPN